MKIPLETIRIGQQGKEKLLKLRRSTGIDQWNVLCRWAFCASIKEKTAPPPFQQKVDGGIEMTWKVFAGDQSDVYAALSWLRSQQDGFPNTIEGAAKVNVWKNKYHQQNMQLTKTTFSNHP